MIFFRDIVTMYFDEEKKWRASLVLTNLTRLKTKRNPLKTHQQQQMSIFSNY